MSKEVGGLNISLKSLLSVSAIVFLLIGEYVVLHKEIEEAKRLPVSEISAEQYMYDKKYIENDISDLQEKLDDLTKLIENE